jgi:hypothetical protein
MPPLGVGRRLRRWRPRSLRPIFCGGLAEAKTHQGRETRDGDTPHTGATHQAQPGRGPGLSLSTARDYVRRFGDYLPGTGHGLTRRYDPACVTTLQQIDALAIAGQTTRTIRLSLAGRPDAELPVVSLDEELAKLRDQLK